MNIVGLKNASFTFHTFYVRIKNMNIHNSQLKFKLIVNGMVYNKDILQKLKFDKEYNKGEYLILQNQSFLVNQMKTCKLYFNHITKFILIYFRPVNETNYWSLNEDYPSINKVSLYCNGYKALDFHNEDLLDFEVFGLKIYLLPFSKDVSDWESICETFKNPLKNLSSSGINMSRIDSMIMHIDYDKEPNNEYDMNVVGISFNVAQIGNGFLTMMYSN
jgi:hypothetical protein